MIKRDLTSHLQTAASKLPAIGLIGPRQSGKTTLARAAFPDYAYVSLEDLDNRLFAMEDPRGFLATYSDPTIMDEIQKAPHLFSYLQTHLDQVNKPGQYILTGSQHFLLHHKISQTLAGRISLFTLLPLSTSELHQAHITFATSEDYIFHGLYPRLFESYLKPQDWYPSYIQTYIERDVRDLKQVTDLTTFQTFVKLCAGRVGQLLNLSSLARDCGITHNTAKAWLSLLETSFIIFLLQPYYENFGKRLVKMPKIYFYDTGLVCSLLGIQSASQLPTHYLRGELFENFIISEHIKQKFNRLQPIDYYFWRNKTGHEVDLLGITADSLIATEIKAGKTVTPHYLDNLHYFNKIHTGPKKLTSRIIYGGKTKQSFHQVPLLPAPPGGLIQTP